MAEMKTTTFDRKNKKRLALNALPARTPAPSSQDAQIPGAIGNSINDPGTLEIGVEFKLDLRNEDLVVMKELGAGNGGTVSKVMHSATKVVMAKKVIHVEAKKDVRRQIVRELHIMHDCQSPNIVTFYGAFLHNSGDVVMCMEYMDCGSLDRISKDFGPVRIDVLGKIAEAILNGLNYLYEQHRIMHRDIKPSNVLVNHHGHIKLCDFGVSGELVNSIADTFVGTSTYMAPERIQGAKYSIKSDVWSVGLTLMELAIGRFPFDASDAAAGDRASAGPMGILDLLQQIVHEPAPKLPESDAFPPYLHDMIGKCLLKSPDERPTPRQLFDKDMFLQAAKRTPVNLAEWAVQMMERHNRKSHLAPQLSPSTQALLRGETSTSPRNSVSNAASTPTKNETSNAKDEDSLPTTSSEPTMSSRITDVNGGDIYPEHAAAADYENPVYPPRTSSSMGQTANRSRFASYDSYISQGNESQTGLTLPIRSGPSGGPSPTPSSSRNGGVTPRPVPAAAPPHHRSESLHYQ